MLRKSVRQPGIEQPRSCPSDEEEYAAQEHRIINPGLMHHGLKTALQNRHFGCCYRNQHVYDERNGSRSGKKAREKKHPDDDFHHSHKGSHDLKGWNTYLDKAANAQVTRKEELLYAFGKKHPTDNK